MRYVRTLASPFTNTTTRGGLTFNTNFTDSGTSSQGGAGLAAILLGFPNAGSRNFLIKPNYITTSQYAGFVQDDLQVMPRLTLNLGLRYDVFRPRWRRTTNSPTSTMRITSSSSPASTA
jgi:outer membrane receptor protein involved in Fe transport